MTAKHIRQVVTSDGVRLEPVTALPGEQPAQTCRRLGWTVGTRIVGDEGYGPTIIEITAIGEKKILAKWVSHNGKADRYCGEESSWELCYRDWQKAASDASRTSATSAEGVAT